MKKVVMILISIMLIGSLSACSSDKTTEPTYQPPINNTMITNGQTDTQKQEVQNTDNYLTQKQKINGFIFDPEEYDPAVLTKKEKLTSDEQEWLDAYIIWQEGIWEKEQKDYTQKLENEETEMKRKELETLFSDQFMYHNRVTDTGYMISAQTLNEAIEFYTESGYPNDLVTEIATKYALSPEEECKELTAYLFNIGITKDKMVETLKSRKVRDTSYFNADDYDWSECAYNLIKACQHDNHNELTDKQLKKILKEKGFNEDEITSAMNKYKEAEGTE